MPMSPRSGLVRTCWPRSVVNSIVSTIVDLRLSPLPEIWTCAEITSPRACWPWEVRRVLRSRSRTPLKQDQQSDQAHQCGDQQEYDPDVLNTHEGPSPQTAWSSL